MSRFVTADFGLGEIVRRLVEVFRRRPVPPPSANEITQPMTIFPSGWDWKTPDQWETEHGGHPDR